MVTRTDILLHLVKTRGYRSYLEIGVAAGLTFDRIPCARKVGVDTGTEHPAITNRLSSDDFFAQNTERFDLIFIDGHHEEHQVLRDVEHALACLNPGGVVVCHDINPAQEDYQRSPYVGNGTCWRAWVRLRATRPDLAMEAVDTDHGCGIIAPGTQVCIADPTPLTWERLVAHRQEWLNLISVDDFYHRYV